MIKRSKRYRAIESKEDFLGFKEALEVIKKNITSKFDETIEIAFNLNFLKKHSIRDIVVYPHSFGKAVKVAVFAKDKKAKQAKEAGADYVGDDDLIKKIEGGWLDFKVAIATPDMMKSIAKVSRILGQKGLMPSPKAKTVTGDVVQAVKSVKAGRREFKVDASGVLNFPVGKASMSEKQILENINEICNAVKKKKPIDIKGEYIKSAYLSSTMGKSISILKKAFL